MGLTTYDLNSNISTLCSAFPLQSAIPFSIDSAPLKQNNPLISRVIFCSLSHHLFIKVWETNFPHVGLIKVSLYLIKDVCLSILYCTSTQFPSTSWKRTQNGSDLEATSRSSRLDAVTDNSTRVTQC